MRLNKGYCGTCTHNSFHPEWKTPYRIGYWEIKDKNHKHICGGTFSEYEEDETLETANFILTHLSNKKAA